jgi:L-aspartate oxidase
VVARSIFLEMQKTGDTDVFLDITHKDRDYLEKRFPTIFNTCLKYGIDMSKDYIPVAPAEHYCMGGIRTGVYGNTTVKNFYACGEAACNGIHGANRLASNSLLEGLVFGNRIGREAEEILCDKEPEMPRFVYNADRDKARTVAEAKRDITRLREAMTKHVGIIRNADGLYKALKVVMEIKDKIIERENASMYDFILQNDVMVSEIIIMSAIERRESRGAHYRSDYTEKNDVRWKKNIVKKLY